MRPKSIQCEQCGQERAVNAGGPVPRWCSTRCYNVSRGAIRGFSSPARVCAVPECPVSFVPLDVKTRCCSERHGKMLWNRESRADGRQKPTEWNDARRDNYHRRRAIKKAATTGAPVRLADIAARDHNGCGLCRKPVDLTLAWPDPLSKSLDHIVPLTKGGSHDPANVQLAHLVCNTAKGNRGGGEQLLLVG